MKYMVSNIGNRNHEMIYENISDGAFFDLSPTQHGWDDYAKIAIGDNVYVIDKKRMISKCYRVVGLVDGVALEVDPVLGEKATSVTGGNIRVLFGVEESVEKQLYSDFVIENKVVPDYHYQSAS